MFYVYFLLLNNGDIYKGSTSNLRQRINEHKLGRVASTRSKRPIKLIYYEAFLLSEDAFSREKILKGQWGNKFLKRVLKVYLENNS